MTIPVAPTQADTLPFLALMDLWRAALVEPSLRLSAASLDFAGRRLQAQSDFIASVAGCCRTVELAGAQSAFAQLAWSDYCAEAECLLKALRPQPPKAA